MTMAKQVLDDPNIDALFKQVGGETVPPMSPAT
jgi:hypothetical protein